MRINRVMFCPISTASNVCQTKMTKPISFGEEDWCGGMPDRKNEKDIKINNFFADAYDFRTYTERNIKYIKKLAKKAFAKGENCGFRSSDGDTLGIDSVTYDVKCRKDRTKNVVTLTHNDDKFKIYFDKHAKTMPKEYNVERENKSGTYSLVVEPRETIYTEKLSNDYKIKSIVHNKQGYTYTEKTDANLKDYERAVVRKFPFGAKSQYIEYISRTFSSDSKNTYLYDSKAKSWVCFCN